MQRLILSGYFLIVFTFVLFSQEVPVSDVYAFDLKRMNDSVFTFNNPRFLTAFNLNGYNNQPYFFDDKTVYLTIQFPDETQTDIYALNLENRQITQITATVESEYSPTLMPDGVHFSSVRVEADGQGTQRLWQFPLDRSTQGEPAFKHITGVGYHCWVSPYKVGFFIVGDPGSQLVLANSLTSSSIQSTRNIGRGFQRLPGDNLAFIQKLTPNSWMLKEMDTYTYRAKDIVTTLPGSEDFVYLKDGTFLMGKGSKLYKFNRYADKEWVEVADFRYYNIENITRLAISPDESTIVIVDRIK